MEWDEINRRLRNGTSVSVLAELAGTTYKNMYNRIRRREQIDGKQYLKPDQLKRPYKAQGGRKKAAFLEKKMHIPEEKKNVPDPGPAASNSSNVILCESCRHFRPGTATDRPYCRKYEHGCGLIYVCSGYAAGGPEVEPIGEEKAPVRPEVAGPDFLKKKMNTPEEKPALEFKTRVYPFPDPEKAGLCQEVIDTLTENYKICLQLAHSYARQANDYKCLLKRYCITVPEKQRELLAAISEVFKDEK